MEMPETKDLLEAYRESIMRSKNDGIEALAYAALAKARWDPRLVKMVQRNTPDGVEYSFEVLTEPMLDREQNMKEREDALALGWAELHAEQARMANA